MIIKIQEDLKQAMRDKNVSKLNVLRQLKTSITNTSIQKGNVNIPIPDLEIINIIRKEISKRKDSIEYFSGRTDLISKEFDEIEILNEYLPVDLTDDELKVYVLDAISYLAAQTKKDMGRVIQRVVSEVSGKADNKRISKMVSDILS